MIIRHTGVCQIWTQSGQIGPEWDNTWTYSDQISVFLPFGATLTPIKLSQGIQLQ